MTVGEIESHSFRRAVFKPSQQEIYLFLIASSRMLHKWDWDPVIAEVYAIVLVHCTTVISSYCKSY